MGAAGTAHTVRPVDLLIPRLEYVKNIKPDRWQARCPAHEDRSPSLSVTETTDGTILIKCWAGCSAFEIVEAVGLELKDLFPQNNIHRQPQRQRYSAYEVVKTVVFETTIVELGFRALQCGELLSDQDSKRVDLAIQTIKNCREVVR